MTEPSIAAFPALDTVYQGDCLGTMAKWPSSILDCTVTSPPYFALRSYIQDGHEAKAHELGSTQTLGEYLLSMGRVFAEVYRLTKPTGTLWVNIGDTWCNGKNKRLCPSDYRPGEALDVPHKLCDEIRSAGWRKMSEVIWHKPNPSPRETGRHPFPSHEYVFQFVKEDNYYDAMAIQDVAEYQPDEGRLLYRHAQSVWKIPVGSLKGRKLISDFKLNGKYLERSPACPIHGDDPRACDLPLFDASEAEEIACECAEVEADFFAAMPLKLAERLIMCSTSEVGNCSVCGRPFERVVERTKLATRPGADVKVDPSGKALKDPKRHVTYRTHAGWKAACGHEPDARVKPIVFDPFAGSGTTPVAAALRNRNWLGCELNPLMVERLIPARLREALGA